MPDTPFVPDTIRCDGCGREVSPAHLRERIARLEWASRFRPIRITTLFLAPAPPDALGDSFYSPENSPCDGGSHALREDLLEASGAAQEAETRQAALARFRNAGFYFAEAVECPVSSADDFPGVFQPLMPTLVRRIRHSYRPQSLVLLSEELAPLALALDGAGVDARPLLLGSKPVPLPTAEAQARARFRGQVQSLLKLANV